MLVTGELCMLHFIGSGGKLDRCGIPGHQGSSFQSSLFFSGRLDLVF